MATCRSSKCGREFIWARSEQNKGIPIDAERGDDGVLRPTVVEDGNVTMTDRVAPGTGGRMVPVVRVGARGSGPHVAHFTTCPDSDSFRNRKKTR
jgi:hypothetical protein